MLTMFLFEYAAVMNSGFLICKSTAGNVD